MGGWVGASVGCGLQRNVCTAGPVECAHQGLPLRPVAPCKSGHLLPFLKLRKSMHQEKRSTRTKCFGFTASQAYLNTANYYLWGVNLYDADVFGYQIGTIQNVYKVPVHPLSHVILDPFLLMFLHAALRLRADRGTATSLRSPG